MNGTYRDPPLTLRGSLAHLGPGIILASAIVGSGELIATTPVGAEAGFVLLWLIVIGCAIKVAAQIEIGRLTLTWGPRGWIRILQLDAWGAMLVYNVVTVAFYYREHPIVDRTLRRFGVAHALLVGRSLRPSRQSCSARRLPAPRAGFV